MFDQENKKNTLQMEISRKKMIIGAIENSKPTVTN